MVKTIVLPMDTSIDGVIPDIIIDEIIRNISNFNDLISFSVINKKTYNYIMNNDDFWTVKLKILDLWGENYKPLIDDFKINALNCLDNKINDKQISRVTFIKIYSILSPILKQLLIDNYSNFQNLNIFNEFSTPISQSRLFSNIGNFLKLYENFNNYNNLIIRFNTILHLFINSVISEIELQLSKKQYSVVLNLITSLDYLNITNPSISVDSLESLLEFFISKNNEDYSYLLNDDNYGNQCFIKEDEKSNKRGIVKGYSFNFDKTDEILNNVTTVLNSQLNEINLIFNSNEDVYNSRNIDEIPIIFKLLENFLSNHLIGGLFDRIISKSKQIDSLDDILTANQKPVNREEEENEDGEVEISNKNINIMNEQSLFFQCVPYMYSKTITVVQNLKYPETKIKLDNGDFTTMNYVKVVCEFVNYYYEQYLIDFSNELPKQCHISLIQLIKAWQSNNQQTQRNIENEILKLVDEDDSNNKKSNFEMFTTFTNLFNFKSKEDRGDDKKLDKEENDNDQIKLTKMAAKLQILIGKVESMKNLVSIDLTVLLLQHIKNSYDLLLDLTKYSITEQLNRQIYETCKNIFNDMLQILINNHIRPGFLEALQRLKNYKPINNDIENTLEPVNNFIELVDVGDLILQMINVFYNHELISNGIIPMKNSFSKDFLKMNNIEKSIKLLESSLDTYVANGLDISIDIIISEIKFKIEEFIGPIPLTTSSNSKSLTVNSRPQTSNSTNTNQSIEIEPTTTVYNYTKIESLPLNLDKSSDWCFVCLKVLNNHFSLLQDSIDKNIMDVFKQELGDRLITLLIQLLMKKFKISVIGGIQFNYDINLLFQYYQKNRIRPAIEYLVGFKKIDQLYLIDCSSTSNKEFKSKCKELGKLIIEIGRDNGVFTPEEVYQFVSRRVDWDKIKKYIDKVVYGFGADECVIM